jgi:excisionase family DNA binding protein
MSVKREIPRQIQTLTIEETAAALRIGRRTVYEMMDRGELPYVTVGKRRRVRVSDVEKILEIPRTTT